MAELSALAASVQADAQLSALIRRKFAIKNTVGYSLNALVDFPPSQPLEIIKHLLVGSEGTLGFVSQVTFSCVPEWPNKVLPRSPVPVPLPPPLSGAAESSMPASHPGMLLWCLCCDTPVSWLSIKAGSSASGASTEVEIRRVSGTKFLGVQAEWGWDRSGIRSCWRILAGGFYDKPSGPRTEDSFHKEARKGH